MSNLYTVYLEPTGEVQMRDNSEIQIVEDMDESPSVQFQNKPTVGTLFDSDTQGKRTCSDEVSHTPAAPSVPANKPELCNRNKSDTTSKNDLNMTPEVRSPVYYRSNNQVNNFLSAGRRYGSIPFSPYNMSSTTQNMSNFEALYGAMNTIRPSNDHKTYTPYVSQDTHSYVGRYCPPSMIAGATIYARNLYPATNEHYHNDQLAGRMTYDRGFNDHVVSETAPASVLGGL